MENSAYNYRGRLAPSPTGLLHLGHARTFWTAQQRAQAARGTLLLRNDDLDTARCRPEFVSAMVEDLRWFGLTWTEPMVTQSQHLPRYRAALARLHAAGLIFPCTRSRRDVLAAASAPHDGDENDEPLYPPEFRPAPGTPLPPLTDPITVNWRFRVPDGETLTFLDGRGGAQHATAGRDFGDFLVWRKDDTPSYQLASVVDDAAMAITEVVRGADLIKSTFRQLLLFRALGHPAPAFYHCPLVNDAEGRRLAKRHDALALRTLREQGRDPHEIRGAW
ncbi:Glutamate--tRNA ligase [Lacunisphaera limnophila]|uniref:Glutamate--tRNA ligase n=1 Tax=Lacunisphaera limnophila TaxID=1838286 RepID=A0A1D8AVE6_9BACT|nr:tRNA glutamyl-Q(34) synthetase GluQRS [Lacunisphaera limnophila]AOS44826.1 Glutamate--tRNA ligase [Lacunisphaera limnophila]